MSEIEMRNTRKIKSFLFGVNELLQTDNELIDPRHCTLEHILPKSGNHHSNWKGFENCNPEEYVHRIGNITLLGGQDNRPSPAYNRRFLKKREVFQKSAIAITRLLSKQEDWTPEAIRKRQQELVEYATKVWALS